MENPLRAFRRALGWSQERVAREIGRSTLSVRLYERGAYPLPEAAAEKLIHVANAAGYPWIAVELRKYLQEGPSGVSSGVDNTRKHADDTHGGFGPLTEYEREFLAEALQFIRKSSRESVGLVRGLIRTLARYETQQQRGGRRKKEGK